jgi:hypothetical protein
VNRNGYVSDDKLSPAKVFTANNTPSFENLPMPTEDFVRNFGRRMHHVAYEVVDGDHQSGEKNVDFVTEYVERCFGYEGFFTKSNVAALTEAAGKDERYRHGNVFD